MGSETLVPSLNPLALIFAIAMCALVMTARREYIIIPLIMAASFITTWQMIVIFNINFPILRFVIVFGMVRTLLRKEWDRINLNTIDKLMIYYSITKIIIFSILWSTFGSFIYMLGQTIDVLGTYFFCRVAIHDFSDYDRIIKTVILVSIPISIFMLYEHFSGGFNIFSLMGGVPEISEIRQGRLRAQGAFSHSILAGTFGAALFPLSWGFRQRGYKLLSVLGMITSITITFASSSSGPVMTLLFSIFGIGFWFLRKYTRFVRNSFFLTIVFLHLVMKAPVWHLISRIDVVGGSTGYHRFRLIDAAINNFWGWFLFGIRSTEVWGRGLWDITNQYIIEGARSGVIGMVLFIFIMGKSFQAVGRSRAILESRPDLQKYIWSFGVILFAYSFTFLSVSFFGQMVFFYYLLIAMISSLNSLPEITDNASTPNNTWDSKNG